MQSITPYIPGLLLFLGAQTAALLSPGPSVFAVMNTSLEKGRANGVSMGLGIGFGSFVLASIALFGLSAVVLQFPKIITVIEFLGGAYFLYLGIKTLRGIKNPVNASVDAETQGSLFKYWIAGVFIQISNPKSIIVWVGLGMLGLKTGAPIWLPALLVCLAFLNSMIWHVLYALLFSTPWLMRKYQDMSSIFKGVFAVVFISIALLLWKKMFGIS